MNKTPPGRIIIERSTPKTIVIVVGSAILTAFSIWFIRGGAVDSRGEASVYIVWMGVMVFGFSLLVHIHRLIFGAPMPVKLSPQGFLDRRAFTQEVPWSAVSRLSVWSHRGTSLLRIQLTDQAMRDCKLTPVGQITRWLNRPLGLDGIYIGSADLDVSFSRLRMLFQEYLSEYNPGAIDDTK